MFRNIRLLVVAFAFLLSGAVFAQQAAGWFGADVEDVTKAEADALQWDGPRGAKLGLVERDSPADKAGLKTGDIVVTVDRTEVDTALEFRAAIEGRRPGAEVRLRVISGGRERRVAVTLAERSRSQASDGSGGPILMLDTGGHMGKIDAVVFTPDGKHIISAGSDKVIRVWDWQAGKTVRTIRGQVGAGSEGKIYAMALSPDGRRLAAAGWMSSGRARGSIIRLFDLLYGELRAPLNAHTNVVTSLAFSADGMKLLSGSADKTAILWNVARADDARPSCAFVGHTGLVNGVGFGRNGEHVVTVSDDGTLKLWSTTSCNEVATLVGHKDKVVALALAPNRDLIASGGWDGEIRLWDAVTGRLRTSLGNQGSMVGALSFTPDGRKLISTCRGGPPCRTRPQIVWDVETRQRLKEPRHHDNIVVAADTSPRGDLVATAGALGEILVWDIETGERRRAFFGTGGRVQVAAFSKDGQRIGWGNYAKPNYTVNDYAEPAFQLRLPGSHQRMGLPEPVARDRISEFLRPVVVHGPYALAHRAGGPYGLNAILDITRDGRTVAAIERDASDGLHHYAYTFTRDGQTIISAGGNGHLRSYDLKGRQLGDFVGHADDVLAALPSPDGRLLVSGSDDQTVRLWNLKTRELIVTLFRGRDADWVMWTPQGYYTGSPGADKIVGWQINRGPERAAEHVGAEQLRQHLNRPDIVEKAIVLASADEAVRQAAGTSFKLSDLLSRPVPRFKIITPLSGSAQRGARVDVKIAIEATPDPVRLLRVQVNGRQVEEQTPAVDSGGFGAGERLLNVPLAKGRNEVRVSLTNAIGEKPETLVLDHEGDGDLDRRGTLHILAIGVNDYKGLGNSCDGAGCDLRYSVADARKLAEAVEKRLGPGHSRVVKRVLINGGDARDAPTASNIIDAVELLRQTGETDTVVLFIAGHGMNDGPDYRFLPTNAERTSGARLGLRGSTVVPWQVLQSAVEAAKGRRLLFLDTCHSGNAYNERLGNAAYHANIFATRDLAGYVASRVGTLAKAMNGVQEPQYFKGRDADDYVLARW